MRHSGIIASAQLSAGSSGGGAYHADAVHFDGTVTLACPALSATDNEYYAISFWGKGLPGAAFGAIHVMDPDGNYQNYLTDSDGTGASIGLDLYNALDPTKHFTNEWQGLDVSSWTHYLIAANTNKLVNQKICAGYFNDVLRVADIAPDNASAFSMAFNGFVFRVGHDGSVGMIGDIADLRIMPGVNLLVSSAIPEATRRLFIDADGKPVNPAVATAAIGAPCMLFSGDATTFATNQGTGGAFTLTGGSLTNASTSPSD